jgi:AmmeMemoRadiSam system protein A
MLFLSQAERIALLRLARAAVTARVDRAPLPEPAACEGTLAEPGAAFVSLHAGDELRGCIGCIEPRGISLAATVIGMAAAAASDDPRFAPLGWHELEKTRIEVSVLGPLVPIGGPADVVVGRDGLVVERGGDRGLLLPQVAVEWGWDADRFVAETCRKAGLPATAWCHGAQLSRFEADVFSEEVDRDRTAAGAS